MNLRHNVRLALVFSAALGTLLSANRDLTHPVSAETKARALANYARLPLSFEENRGQADAPAKYVSHGNCYSILLTPSEVVMNLQAKGLQSSSIRMSFAGGKAAPEVAGVDRQTALSSYFVGNDSSKWVSGAPNYSRVMYREVYPGVDVVFYGNQSHLEYDFVLAPGANPNAIRLQFEGLEGMRIDGSGNLILKAANGEIEQHKPLVYQETSGVRQAIPGRYTLQAHNRVAFEIAQYDTRKPLVIDPTLSFGTYIGSPGEEVFGLSAAAATTTYPAVAVDSQGNVYVTGYNGSSASSFTGHPKVLTSTGPELGGGVDVFVLKMNATGNTVLYSAVFGGGLTDIGDGIAVDGSGNAYVTGYTSSTNFPITTGAAQITLNGGTNAFVTKVNSTGTALVYSTFLGGSGNFWGRGIALDKSGNAYVTGTAAASGSTPFPLVNPISSTPSSGFLSEINSTGTGFAYSTYLPNAGIGYDVVVDGSNNAYVTGSTGTSTAPSPAQAYVLKVNAGGTGIAYTDHFGNSGTGLQTVGFGIALDAQNNAYVTGMTNDTHFPQLSNAAQATFGGGLNDGFVVKVSSSGSLVYGTYIGGIGSNILPERGSAIGVDTQGNAWVAGTTQCIGFPSTNSIGGVRNGGPVALAKGTISGSTSNWSAASLTGNFDQVTALAFDPSGNLYAGASALNASGGGVYKLPSGSSTWSLATSGITSSTIDALAVDPNATSTLYAAGSGHLFQTTNGGSSWTQLGQPVGTTVVLAVAKTSPSTVYAGSSLGLIYSTSNGSTWNSPTTPPGSGAVSTVIVDPNNSKVAYAGTSTGVYQTTNGGAVWAAVNNGLPTGVSAAVSSLAITNNSSTVYAATLGGLYYTTNGGSSWTPENLGQIASTPVLVTVDAASNVFAAFQQSGVGTGTSCSSGQCTWSALTYNGLTQNQVTSLATPPSGSGTAYAGIVAATNAFLTELSPSGSFVSSTCIGGSDNNLGQNIAVTSTGAVYVTGLTTASNFPTTAGAIQTKSAGLYDAFVLGVNVPAASGIFNPPPGFELSDTSDTFSWAAVNGATLYQLSVGTTPGGTNVFLGTTTATSQTVDYIPCTGGTIYVQLAAQVNGSYQPPTSYTYTCRSGNGDFNADGSQDLVWQNTSTGQVNVNYFGGVGPQPQGSAVLNNGSTLSGWKVVGAADFDRNGTADLVIQNTSTLQVNVNYYSGSTMTGSATLSTGVGMTGQTVVAIADMNGDGVPDLIWQNAGTGQVTVYYYTGSTGTTQSGSAVLNSGSGTAGWKVVAAADFDGNGVPDLIWQNTSTGQVNVNYYGGTNKTTLIGFAVLNSGSGTAGWSVVAAADMNADNIPDLIWQNNTTLQINVNYYGGGGGAVLKGFNCLNCSSSFVGSTLRAVANFNTSGEPSLVWQNNSTNAVTAYYYGLGGYIFLNWALLNSGSGTAGWHVVGAGDFDGNGVPDLIWQNISTGQVNVNYYGGTGGSTLTGFAVLNTGAGTAGWSVVAVADMNGDGVPDLIWQNSSTGQVNVNYYGGAGGATLTGFAVLNSGSGTAGWKVVAAADFDGNGIPDLVWQNTSSRQVNVNYYGGSNNTTVTGFAVLNSGSGAAGWSVVGASDFDGNGVPDLVWRNDSQGQVNVNYYGGAKGAIYKGWNVLNGAANPGWSVIVPRSR